MEFLHQVSNRQEVTDHRFFIRSIVRHSDFVTKVSKTMAVTLFDVTQTTFWDISFVRYRVLRLCGRVVKAQRYESTRIKISQVQITH